MSLRPWGSLWKHVCRGASSAGVTFRENGQLRRRRLHTLFPVFSSRGRDSYGEHIAQLKFSKNRVIIKLVWESFMPT